MDYKKVLELCGAEVFYMKNFGSYQGDWWAKVKYKNKVGWVHDYFGSCSGCDNLENIFYKYDHKHGDNYFSIYDSLIEDCEDCINLKSKLILLGESYLEDIMSQEEAEQKAEKNLEWDHDAREMLFQIKLNSI